MEYCLRIQVPKEHRDSYSRWLEEHSQAVVDHPGFLRCHILQGPDQQNPDFTIFHVRYELQDEQSFRNYLKGPAQKMRQEGLDKFGAFVNIQRDLVSSSLKINHRGTPWKSPKN